MGSVADQINQQRDLSVSGAQTLLEQVETIAGLAEDIAGENANPYMGYSTLNDPDIDTLALEPSSLPVRPNFIAPDTVQLQAVPTFDNLPQISEIETFMFSDPAPAAPPSSANPAEGITTPTFSGVTATAVPTAPTLTSFSFPDLSSLALGLPDPPTLTYIVEYSAVLPELSVQAPAPVLNYTEQTYVSALKNSAEAWLMDLLTNGGTGLHPDVEQAIWNRATSREITLARENLENTVNEFAGSNFPMPPGALLAATRKVRNNLQDRLADLNRDISYKQAEMAKAASEFAVNKALELEALMIRHFDTVAERAFQVAKATVDLSLSIFNARVAEFNARLTAYRAGAEVHELKLRMLLQQLENYKALLQGKQIEGTLRQQEVDLYRAKLDSQKLLIDQYRAQAEAVSVANDIERLKIEEFKTRVMGMEAELKKAEVGVSLRNAQLTGYRTEVDAYATRAGVVKTQNDIQIAKIQTEIERIQALITDRTARYQVVNEQNRMLIAKLSAQVEVNRGLASIYASDAGMYGAEVTARRAAADVEIQKWSLIMDTRKQNSEVRNQKFQREADIFRAVTEAKIGAMSSISTSLANAAAAALSSLTSLTQAVATEDVTE